MRTRRKRENGVMCDANGKFGNWSYFMTKPSTRIYLKKKKTLRSVIDRQWRMQMIAEVACYFSLDAFPVHRCSLHCADCTNNFNAAISRDNCVLVHACIRTRRRMTSVQYAVWHNIRSACCLSHSLSLAEIFFGVHLLLVVAICSKQSGCGGTGAFVYGELWNS